MTDGSRFSVWKAARRSDDRVPGTLHVRRVHPVGSGGVGFGAGYRLEGEVSAPGLPPTRISHIDSLPSVHELAGIDLPVLVDPTRPDRLRIQWREVGDLHKYVQETLHARAAAERVADSHEAEAANTAEAAPYQTVVRQLRAAPADEPARVGVGGQAKLD